MIEPRLTNPAALLPDAWEGIQKLLVAVQKGGLPANILDLTHMRASQINGCSACMDGTVKQVHKTGELADRPDPVPDDTWARVAAHFDDRALAALMLHVALTNLFNRLNVTRRQASADW